MRYTVTVGGRTVEVAVEGSTVRVDGRSVTASLERLSGTPIRRLVIDGRAQTLAVSRAGRDWLLQLAGERCTASVIDERARHVAAVTGGRAAAPTGGIVRAPMPGLVLRVEVEVGQHVAGGAGLLVLEAMKMENEIRAPAPGVVAAIRVRPGEAVEKGAVLAELGEG